MEHSDKVMLAELAISAEVDANTIKNEIIIGEIAELIKTEEHTSLGPPAVNKQGVPAPRTQSVDPQNLNPLVVPGQTNKEEKLSIVEQIRKWAGTNLKYIGIACLAVAIQILLYHIPQINQKMLEISPRYSTQLKMFFSFVLVYWAQKEIHRICP